MKGDPIPLAKVPRERCGLDYEHMPHSHLDFGDDGPTGNLFCDGLPEQKGCSHPFAARYIPEGVSYTVCGVCDRPIDDPKMWTEPEAIDG